MPCNGVSVASLSLNNDIKMFLQMYTDEQVNEVIKNYLTRKNISYQDNYYGIDIKNGININYRNGSLRIEYDSYSSISRQVKETLEPELTKLLEALAGVKRQEYIIAKLKDKGVKVNTSQTAKNGAKVLTTTI